MTVQPLPDQTYRAVEEELSDVALTVGTPTMEECVTNLIRFLACQAATQTT